MSPLGSAPIPSLGNKHPNPERTHLAEMRNEERRVCGETNSARTISSGLIVQWLSTYTEAAAAVPDGPDLVFVYSAVLFVRKVLDIMR